jgi:hypothetical protein
MIGKDSLMAHSKIALIRQASGGTGYAVQMAINENKPVYIFDMQYNRWFKCIDGQWSYSDVPVLTKHFAGIGSHEDSEFTEAGREAIRQVYRKTFGIAEPEMAKSITTLNVEGNKPLTTATPIVNAIDKLKADCSDNLKKVASSMGTNAEDVAGIIADFEASIKNETDPDIIRNEFTKKVCAL